MTHTLHTQKSLDALTWNEVQKIHASLGLKATATTRTRRDYQRRIVEAMPQPIAEPEAVATSLTCATCPLARHIDGNRYCCGLTDAVVRGNWEAKGDCYQEIANLETEMTELIASAEVPVVTFTEVEPEAPIKALQPVATIPAPKETYRYRWNQGWHSFTCWCDKCNLSNPPTVTLPEDKPPQGDNGCEQVEATTTQQTQQTVAYPQSARLQPAWYIEMMAEIREYQKSLPNAPKPSKLYTKLCQELEVGDYLKTDYAVTRRRTQIVAAKKILPDGRIHFILNCGINPREVFSQEVWLDAPITQPTITEPVTPETVATTTDDTLPNQGDNGRGRVTALTALPEATIVLPHATKPKADDNFMSSMVKENAFDKAFYDMTYLLEQQLKAQLAVERTVIGSEDEAIALMHLKKIDEDIEYYDRPVIEPQPSPIVVQLENQMKELKADTLKLFKIEPFDQSILPTETDEPEQSATQSKPEPEGTIHWTTPQRGVIVGKKGATRHFYIRNDEILIVLSGEFTASETKHPNIRHRQIREAINLGRTFNPRIFKVSPNFERDTQVCNGGRIRQECDGRWWAWADGGVTGQPFPYENLATQYLERIAASKQASAKTNALH